MASWDLPRDPLEALREGDPGPFEAFVKSHARVFFAYFRRRGAGLHRAEDLTQDVLLKLYAHAPRYRAEERFQALCFRVAENVWIDDRRRRGTRGRLRPVEEGNEEATLDPDESGDAALERLAIADEAGRLRAALERLPESHRRVFELGVVDELPYVDIARQLEIPVGTVKSRMFHAVRKLRGLLGEGAA